MKQPQILFYGPLFFLCSCNSTTMDETKQSQLAGSNSGLKKIEKLNWLAGSWKNISENSTLIENWTKINDSLYSGNSFVIENKDTVFSEKISLQLIGADLFYIPAVADQNNGQPVSFKLISDGNEEFIFENKEHDFPQQIVYKNPRPDSLYARIEGMVQGVFRKEEFFMKREK